MEKKEKEKTDAVRLERRLTLVHGIAILCGIMIGSGIYISPKGVLRETGSVGLSLTIWLSSGFIALIGSCVYAELGTTYPKSGGMYHYLDLMFGPFFAFLYVWFYTILIRPGSNTVTSLTFGMYLLQPFFPDCAPPHSAVLLAAILLAGVTMVLNSLTIKISAGGQTIMSTLSVSCLAVIGITGLVYICGYGMTDNLKTGFEGSTPSLGNIVTASVAGNYAYAGWSVLNNMTEELKNPYQNLPRAIFISLAIVTVAYLLVNTAYLAVLGVDGILKADAVAVAFAYKTMGAGAWVIGLFIAISCAGSYNSALIFTSRLTFVAGRRGHLPRALALINIGYKSPMASLIFQTITIIIMLLVGDVYTIITLISLLYYIFDVMMVGVLIYWRYKFPDIPRPIKFPIFIPMIHFVVKCILLTVPMVTKPMLMLLGLGYVLGTGIPFYVVFVMWEKRPVVIERFKESFLRLEQKLLLSVPAEEDSDSES